MERINVRKKKVVRRKARSRAEAADRTGYCPKITVRGRFLTLRWSLEQAPEAMDWASMNPKDVFTKYLSPRLDATKTISFKYRGLTQSVRVPDWNARFKPAMIILKIVGIFRKDYART
jgi:hypothetical protein